MNQNGKKTILIVDDAPANISHLSKLLKEKYRVMAATEGEKALQIAAAEDRPDLVLLDIMMPGMDGYEVCRRLKSNPITEDIPVIFITGKDTLTDEAKGLMLGAVDFIMKPIDPMIVEARIRVHLFLRDQWNKRERAFLDRIELLEEENRRLKERGFVGARGEA